MDKGFAKRIQMFHPKYICHTTVCAIIVMLMMGCGVCASAQGDSARYELQVGGGAMAGYAIPHNMYARDLLTGCRLITGYNVSMGWRARGEEASVSDELYGRPTIEGGLMVLDYQHVPLHNVGEKGYFPGREPSSIGQMITPYAAVSRPLFSTRDVELGFYSMQGIGICTHPYDLVKNPENEFVGARFAILISLGMYGKVRLSDHWNIGATAQFHHYSNGRLDFPNMGINSGEGGVQLIYSLNPEHVHRKPYDWVHRADSLKTKWGKHLYVDVNASWMPRVLLAEWLCKWYHTPKTDPDYRTGKFSYHHSVAFDASLMYRYSRKFASGIGVEYIYAPIGEDIKYWEDRTGSSNPLCSPHGLNVSLQHEAFYKNIGVHLSLGYYIKREPQQENDQISPVFETVGLRYYLPVCHRRLYIGYNIRARATTADCFQFSLGYRIGGKK